MNAFPDDSLRRPPAPAAGPGAERGVYCLANDTVIEWFEAFIRSFRLHNPTLPLTVIPYNKSMARLAALQREFNFTILTESECSRFDGLAYKILGQQNVGEGTFRKLICFSGPYREFLFLDSDIVVLQSLDGFLDAFARADYDFVHFDVDITMCYAPLLATEMVAKYSSHGFNSGAFLSRRGVLSDGEIFDAAEQALAVRDHFMHGAWEQPFLNYALDILRRRIAHINTLLPEITLKPWAGMSFRYDPASRRLFDAENKLLPFLHWAGWKYPTMVKPEMFLRYRTLNFSMGRRLIYYLVFYSQRGNKLFRKKLQTSRKLARLRRLVPGLSSHP